MSHSVALAKYGSFSVSCIECRVQIFGFSEFCRYRAYEKRAEVQNYTEGSEFGLHPFLDIYFIRNNREFVSDFSTDKSVVSFASLSPFKKKEKMV